MQIFLKLYKLLWFIALPFLRRNARLRKDFDKRISSSHFEQADVWIQAASAGEAYLAVAIIKQLQTVRQLKISRQLKAELNLKILISTTTTQGRDILFSNLCPDHIFSNSDSKNDLKIDLKIEWFPFDIPAVINEAVTAIKPKVMILLETEIWPSLLYYLKQNGTKIIVANARMSKKSFRFYKLSRFLWKHLAPDIVLSVWEQDGEHFQAVFESGAIEKHKIGKRNIGIESVNIKKPEIKIIPNIKFEIPEIEDSLHPFCREYLSRLFSGTLPLTILASVRKQEEKEVLLLIKNIVRKFPDQLVGIVPRHMNRINVWKKILSANKLQYSLRSDFDSKNLLTSQIHGLKTPDIILWDVFGELKTIYEFASVVFVGGSLKALGGQNMLEPLIAGSPTVIGPYYEDFAWAAEAMIQKELLIKKNSWEEIARTIVSCLEKPVNRNELRDKVKNHLKSMQGGAQIVCDEIIRHYL